MPVTNQRRILAVFNPAAGRGRRARCEDVIAAVRALGCSITMIETQSPGHAETIARAAADIDVIVVAGGDGTVNEIVNGLQDRRIALGVIPLGTANVLADEMKLPRAPHAVARVLAEGRLRPIRVGIANSRRFVMMTGTGFDGRVVAGVSLALKKKLGPLAYVWQTAKLAFSDDFVGCTVTVDGVAHDAVSAVVCKGRYYGGPFVAVPAATITDDLLHVVLMHGRGPLSVLRYGTALMLGRLGALHDVTVIPGRRVRLVGVAGAPVQADGDIITALPAEISIDPEPVQVMWPK